MICLDVKKPINAKITRLAVGLFAALSFVYAGAYNSFGTFQTLPYLVYLPMEINAWLALFGYGLFAYVIYYVLSNLAYNMAMGSCMRLTGVYNYRPLDKGVFRLNVDICYAMANLIIGSIRIVYFYFPYAHYVGGSIIAPIVVAAFMTLCYFMIRTKVKKEYYFPLFSGLAIPFLIMLMLV